MVHCRAMHQSSFTIHIERCRSLGNGMQSAAWSSDFIARLSGGKWFVLCGNVTCLQAECSRSWGCNYIRIVNNLWLLGCCKAIVLDEICVVVSWPGASTVASTAHSCSWTLPCDQSFAEVHLAKASNVTERKPLTLDAMTKSRWHAYLASCFYVFSSAFLQLRQCRFRFDVAAVRTANFDAYKTLICNLLSPLPTLLPEKRGRSSV